ncbi:hypothetical protein SAMN02745166_03878 [Prosthecobacter debontii]|uniref:Uncharacterized protein n=2 Tax=Prosthecobacter debontii TaxID=48467 RepID=A0A1T4YPN7_9BACT|nr:hypothetical protein SAMN02745166_03878 [Prosthecobacter debontii]
MRASTLVALCFLTGCELPPRESWNIIQRDGLLTYWSRAYNPVFAPSRYLSGDSRPFVPSSSAHVPYRPRTEQSRYLAAASGGTSSPSPPKRIVKPETSPEDRVQEVPKIPLEPARPLNELKPKPEAPSPKPSMADLPYGTPVPGRPGMVNSPFAEKQQLVDVTGMAPGEAVKDPYTGKLFRVPPTEQAAASTTEPASAPASAEDSKPQP